MILKIIFELMLFLTLLKSAFQNPEQDCKCGRSIPRNNRIYRGDIAPKYRYPWQIFIQMKSKVLCKKKYQNLFVILPRFFILQKSLLYHQNGHIHSFQN